MCGLSLSFFLNVEFKVNKLLFLSLKIVRNSNYITLTPSDAAKVQHLQSSAKSSVQHHNFCFFSQGPDEIHVSALIVGLLNLRPKPHNSDTMSAAFSQKYQASIHVLSASYYSSL